MKIFESDNKINFVDKNNVFVGFDSTPRCCEEFGWFVEPNIIKTDVITLKNYI